MKSSSRTFAGRPADGCAQVGANPPEDVGLDLANALGQPAADRRIDILRRIEAGGSISEAARDAGVSYRAAWQAIETLGNLAGQAMVEKAVGGIGGGGARLTAAGKRVLAVAERLEAARRTVLSGPDDALPGLTLRTSLRNLLRCRVRKLESQSGLVCVELETSASDTLRSTITLESAELLGLCADLPVLALFKAAAVGVSRAPGPRTSPKAPEPPIRAAEVDNRLAGRVVRTMTQPAGEASLELAGGEHITGFTRKDATPPSIGSTAIAHFPASAVIIALP